MILTTEKRNALCYTCLVVAVSLLLASGPAVSDSLLAGEAVPKDQRKDLKPCFSGSNGCSSCRIQTVEELREKLPYIDILEASVRRKEGDSPRLIMDLTVAEPIPYSSQSFTSYSFALDLDGNSDTGFRADEEPLGVFPELGVDLWVSLTFYQGQRKDYLFIGPSNVKRLNRVSGSTNCYIDENRKRVVFSVPVDRVERKLSFAYLHVKPEFKLELNKAEWTAFTTRETIQYPKDNPICDFHPDRHFREGPEGCLLRLPLDG